MPARTRFRTAVRRGSCGMRPGHAAARQASFHAFVMLRMALGLSPSATMRQKTHGDVASLFQANVLGALRQQQPAERVGHGEDATIVILGGARVQAHFAAGEVNLMPFEREYLVGHAPARDVGERDNRPQLGWQMLEHGLVLLVLEEPLPNIILTQHGDLRFTSTRRDRIPSASADGYCTTGSLPSSM